MPARLAAAGAVVADGGPLLVSPERAGELLGLSRATVYVLMGRGELVSVKIGGARRITVASVEAIASGTASAGRPAPTLPPGNARGFDLP